MKVEKTCQQCGKTYRLPLARAPISKYCSRACRNAHDRKAERRVLSCESCGSGFEAAQDHGKWPRFCSRRCWQDSCIVPEHRECESCGTMFLARKSTTAKRGDGRRLFCSEACRHEGLRRGDELTCQQCGKAFYAPPNREDQRCCSKECQREFYRDSASPAWKGGSYVGVRGDKYINLGGSKYIAEHRLVAARAIGRKLFSWEFVIRIDRDPSDNSPDNLFICASNSEFSKRRNGSLPWPSKSNLHTYADRVRQPTTSS